ncbi:MAG: Spy/CpxP family protein refolding chaperone [Enhygromyxa sp.]
MPRKIALLFAATLMFTTTACDSADETVEDRAADAPDANPDELGVKHGKHGKRGKHGKHNPAEKLCSVVECSDAQAAQVSELFAKRHEGRDDGAHEARKAARAEAHKQIAAAFRAERFDASVLERVGPPEHDGADHEAKMIGFATELHAILTPEQRAKLADKIEAKGPMFLGGHHGKGHHGKGFHGKKDFHGKKGDGEGKVDRLAHKVERFCEPISCTADQQTRLSAAFEGAHEARRDAKAAHAGDKPDFKPLADAFRAESLDEAKLRAVMGEGKVHMQERKLAHGDHMKATLAEIHEILTPEQRAIVADKIEAEGLHALMGKGKRHGKKGHGKKGKQGKQGHHGSGPSEVTAG